MTRGREALLGLALISISACVHTPAQQRAGIPAAVIAPATAAADPAATAAANLATPAAEPAADPTPASPPSAAPAAQAPAPVTADTAVPAAAAQVPPESQAALGLSPASTAAAAPDAAGPAAASAADSTTVVTAPAQYSDLFDRMRAGFRLDDSEERHAVESQLRWYANNPEYLQRAFGRADLYLYHIVTELEARGMPLELALLPVVESAFEPYAYSRARASGLWQFIPGTGSRYGLRQDWWYDGRRDIVESTRAALDYLQSLHDEFNGDWLLAIAAYNCGELIVERSVAMNRAAGRPVTFWDLWLPRETRAYVPKLLAMRRLVLDPGAYGLAISRIPNQPYFTRVATGGQISFKVAAEISGVAAED